MIDDDDRQAIGQGAVRLLAYGVLVLAGAATAGLAAGLAVWLFQIVSGI
jgi:hypothetical protein